MTEPGMLWEWLPAATAAGSRRGAAPAGLLSLGLPRYGLTSTVLNSR